jgi:flagellar biogenesis protein FliO
MGQSSAGPADEELLLSYRRAGAADAAGSTGNGQPASAASTPGGVENPLRPTNEPAAESMPVYQFPDASQAPPAYGQAASTSPVGKASASGVEAVTPQPVATEQTPPGNSLPRYGTGVEQAVHNESAPVEAAEHKQSQPTPEPHTPEPHTPKEAPLAATPLPGVALPLTTDYSPASDTPASDESRHLAPRSKPAAQLAGEGQSLSDGIKSRLPASFSKLDSLTTAGAGLAIVVGLFFVCMWLLRRSSGAKHGGVLPNEAFAVLGRAPLTPQSFAQLLRVGNKLVLVAISADGIQPLTEVIDPIEVDRLTGVCASGRGHGPAAEFQQVLAQLAREPARGFLGAEAANGGGRRRA